MALVGSFTADITKFVEKTKLKASTVVKKLAFDAFASVMLRTPVDTGRARASWRISVNQVDSSVEPDRGGVASKIKGAPAPPDPAESGKATSALAGVNWGDVVYISNSVPYIEALENGWSKQAPQGMLRLAFEEVKANFSATVASVV